MPKSRKGFKRLVKIGGRVGRDVAPRDDEASLLAPEEEGSWFSELLHTINDAGLLFIVDKVIGARVNGLFKRTKLVIRRWLGAIAAKRQEEPARPIGIFFMNSPCIF
jgi:hypothetical protein